VYNGSEKGKGKAEGDSKAEGSTCEGARETCSGMETQYRQAQGVYKGNSLRREKAPFT
jgi:hypothetical protein